MGKHNPPMNRGNCLEPTAFSLLGEPLEFIHEDHLREREICVMIDAIARGDASERAISIALEFLRTELPLHLRDEEEDLFPLLRRRCLPEDEIEKVIKKLLTEHQHAEVDTPEIIELFEDFLANPRMPTDEEQKAMSLFASHSRRHLILENAVILPFARLRLTQNDILSLHIRMCQRRGVEHLKDMGDAK